MQSQNKSLSCFGSKDFSDLDAYVKALIKESENNLTYNGQIRMKEVLIMKQLQNLA